MNLQFLDRGRERQRLEKAFARRQGSFCCLYGRRRCGKSRLLQEALPTGRSVYYVGDEREAPLQRVALARAIDSLLPGFAQVEYPDWESLLGRWWGEAPPGAVLAIDELPYLVNSSRELPGILQKQIDQHAGKRVHLVVCGSSQRMMQGLVLDASAPLYGRAREIIHVKPLEAGWISEALKLKGPFNVLEAYSIWGGVPRYWELTADYPSTWKAVSELVLDPMGVLHDEPHRLLLDDMRETAQPASILSLVGQGVHRITEIAGRLGKPVTSLSHPLKRLMDLGLIDRELPFGAAEKRSKRTLYRIADPFLRFWFRYVQANRSRLEARMVKEVQREIRKNVTHHMGGVWEDLAREAIPRLRMENKPWMPARRWWGAGLDHKPMECDVVAESADRKTLLVGEVKLKLSSRQRDHVVRHLEEKIRRLPFASSYRKVVPVIFTALEAGKEKEKQQVTLADVLMVLR